MQKLFYIFATLVLAGCTVSGIGDDTVELRSEGAVYTAGFEQVGTKVYVDTDLKSHWTADDRISIFSSTYNEEYRFDGQTGDNSGTFTRVGTGNGEGSELPTSYAVYPFSDGTSISAEGEITVSLPAVQSYAENSYGLGANTMVAVAESKTSNALFFRNVCGYVVVRLYGEGSVKSISITGNNNEKIAGAATVKAEYGQAPVVTMSESATTSITLDCGDGVALGKTADDATAFWFAVPPVTFSQGFTIRVTNTDLWSMEKSTSVERTITRNIKNPLSPLEANFDIPREGNIEFEDEIFKAYCVKSFDTNGDGEISYAEARVVSLISCNRMSISSLEGIQYFTSLKELWCGSNQLTALDVSNNTALTVLWCDSNQLTTLGVRKNGALNRLYCGYNQLTALDVSGCTALTDLACYSNQLTSLDVRNNTALTNLACHKNQLTALDVSNNTALSYLFCYKNQLTGLDVNHNTALEYLDCNYNELAALDISNNIALTSLDCYFTRLTELDVSNNTALTYLNCSSNYLTSLDVSNNTKLINLDCCGNQLMSLDVSKNTALVYFDCRINQLTSLDVSKNTALTFLGCDFQLTSLDVSHNTALTCLDCSCTQLTSLDVSHNTALERLYCYNTQLTSLDVSNNTVLKELWCYSNPYLTEIWLKTGQTISDFKYDTDVATIYYK